MKETLAILCAAALAAGFYMTSAGADRVYTLPFGPVTFDDGAGGPYMPLDWTIVDGYGDGNIWHAASEYEGHDLGTGPFAFVKKVNPGEVDEVLITPMIDTAGLRNGDGVILAFDHYFKAINGEGVYSNAIVDISTDDGSTWDFVYNFTNSKGSWTHPDHHVIDISTYASPTLKARFIYNGYHEFYFDSWWMVDNLIIGQCWDADGDGHYDSSCAGDDCEDTDPDIYPGALEISGNGIDDDCDGYIDELGIVIHVPEDYPTIQECIEAAVDGDTCLVAPGDYVENINFLGKAITVTSEAGPEETQISGRDCTRGEDACSTVTFNSSENNDAIIDGFKIRFGIGTYKFSCGMYEECGPYYYGGGVFCDGGSSPTISNCIITYNDASYQNGQKRLGKGGGIYGSPVITNCLIKDNYAGLYGGAIYGSPTITNSTIIWNYAGFWHDGPYGRGGGIYGSPVVTNCILYYNSTEVGPDEISEEFSSPTVTYSDVAGGWPGEGNIDSDPLFVSYGDYHLTADSPCIDTGTDAEVYTDIDGDVRPQGEGFDMGSDEYMFECWDLDADGYADLLCGGDDCDDSDPDVNPEACEHRTAGTCDDGIDNDCDGLIDTDPECTCFLGMVL